MKKLHILTIAQNDSAGNTFATSKDLTTSKGRLETLPQRALPCSDFLGASGIFYTDEEYEKHCMRMQETEATNAFWDYLVARKS